MIALSTAHLSIGGDLNAVSHSDTALTGQQTPFYTDVFVNERQRQALITTIRYRHNQQRQALITTTRYRHSHQSRVRVLYADTTEATGVSPTKHRRLEHDTPSKKWQKHAEQSSVERIVSYTG